MYSIIELVASGGQDNFAFPFDYLSQTHIFVFSNDIPVLDTDFSFLNPSTITLDTPASVNDVIRIARVTPIDGPIVDFVNGSVLGEDDLDTGFLQVLFATQEYSDVTDLLLSAEAVEDVIDAAAAALASAAAAAASATAASTAETNAELAETNAETAETNAELAEANAETAEANAETAETNAELAETNAETAEAGAQAAATGAAASAVAASDSADAAALSAAKLQGTSATSLLIEVGSKVFTTQASKFFDVGTWLLIVSDADETNYMHGQVTAYSGGSLTVDVTNIGGSGTLDDWTIMVSGTRGAEGTPGAGSTIVFASEGVDVGTRSKLNLLEGDNIALTVVDDAGNDRVDVTVEADLTEHEGLADPHTQYVKEGAIPIGLVPGDGLNNNLLTSDGSVHVRNSADSANANLFAEALVAIVGRYYLGASGNRRQVISLDADGSPEAVVTADVGSLYLRRDGGTNITLYLKQTGTGNTGWIAVPTTPTAARGVASTDSLVASDRIIVLTGASFTFTLTTAVGNAGRVVDLRHNGTSLTQVYTIATTSSQLIAASDGTAAPFILYTNGETLTLMSDGTNWQVLGHHAETGWMDAGAITIGATTTSPTKPTTVPYDHVFWKRSGNMAHLKYTYQSDATTGSAAGTGAYLFGLPTGIAFGPSITPVATIFATAVRSEAVKSSIPGVGAAGTDSVSLDDYRPLAYSTTQFMFGEMTPGQEVVSATFHALTAAEAHYWMSLHFEVANWRA
jgi:tail fiber protein